MIETVVFNGTISLDGLTPYNWEANEPVSSGLTFISGPVNFPFPPAVLGTVVNSTVTISNAAMFAYLPQYIKSTPI